MAYCHMAKMPVFPHLPSTFQDGIAMEQWEHLEVIDLPTFRRSPIREPSNKLLLDISCPTLLILGKVIDPNQEMAKDRTVQNSLY